MTFSDPKVTLSDPTHLLLLERNDERDKNAMVKTPTQWYPSQTGSDKAHANTSLPSKKNFGIMNSIKRANPDVRTRAQARKLRVCGDTSVKEHARICMEITRRSSGTTFQRYLMKLFRIISLGDGWRLPSGGKRRAPRHMAPHGTISCGRGWQLPGGGWWLLPYSRLITVLARWSPSEMATGLGTPNPHVETT